MYRSFLVNFSLGLRKKDSPRIFKDGECSIAQDCYFDEAGNVHARKFNKLMRNFSSPIKTIFPYGDRLIITLEDGSLYDSSGTLIDSDVGADKFSCVEYDNVLYMTNRFSNKRLYNSELLDMGNVAPIAAPSVSIENTEITDCNTNWTASANVTSSVDEHDYKNNPDDDSDEKAIKLEIASGFTTGVVAYYDVTSIDLSSYTHIGLWVKANANVNAGVLELLLDNTSGCVSPLETIDIPALVINTWQWVVLELSDPSLLTAIISVGLNANSDPGAIDVRLDRIIAMTDGNLDGAYYYKYSYLDKFSNESSYSPISTVVNCAEEQAKVTVVASDDAKVSYVKIYRLGGTLADWYYVATVNNTDQTYTDNNDDNDLITLAETDVNAPPPSGLRYIAEHYERIIGANDSLYENSALYTKEYKPEYWGLNLNQQYLISNKDKCTGLMSWGRYVVYYKKDRIYVLEGTNPVTWHRRRSDSKYGNIAEWALEFYQMPIFLTWTGLYFFDQNNSIGFSSNVKEFFNENKLYLQSSIGCIFDDKYYLSVPDANVVLVYDFIHKIFYTYSMKLTEMHYNYIDGNLYAGDEDDNLVLLEQDENATDYDTLDLRVKSKAYNLNDIHNATGELLRYIISLDTKGDDVTFNIYIDETLKQSTTLNTTGMTRVIKTFGAKLKGRYAEFEIVYDGKKAIEIEAPIAVNPEDL